MRTTRLLLIIALALAANVRAQPMTGAPAVDSAAVARAAWARASSALQQHDDVAARREIDRAAHAWPLQPAYLWAAAVLAAHAHDTLATLNALEAYADLGLGHAPDADSSLAAVSRAPRLASVARRIARNDSVIGRSEIRATLTDSSTWPEGMDYDPRTHRFYLADVAHHTVVEIAGAASRDLWARDRRDIASVLGVRVDTARRVLWATTSPVRQAPHDRGPDTAGAELLRIRISDGSIERRWRVTPRAAGHVLGDLTIDPRGDVFVTDSNDPVLYRLRSGTDTLESLRNPLFHSLQGLAPDPSGRVLYLSDYSHGLLRVDLATGAVERIDDAPHSTSLGCDGIAWYQGSIIAVQNGLATPRIARFVLSDDGRRVTRVEVLDRNIALADEPTIGALVGDDFVYVANSQWSKHDDRGRRVASRVLTPARLLSVPITFKP